MTGTVSPATGVGEMAAHRVEHRAEHVTGAQAAMQEHERRAARAVLFVVQRLERMRGGFVIGPSNRAGPAPVGTGMSGEQDFLVIVPGSSTGLVVRQLADGSRTLPVFTSVARLVDELGPQQPWVCLPMQRAAEVATREQVDRVALDPVLR